MEHDSDGDPLSSLLAMLRAKTQGSPTSVVNETTINLMYQLLSRDPKDYVNIAERISNDSDVEVLLDFVLLLLRERHLSGMADGMHINLRARRLMLKVTTRTPAIPWSLIVTGATIQSEHSLLGSGGFGRVFKGELGGAPVALKVLYKTHNNIDFRREALMWRSLNHDHVLPFLGIYEDDSASYLVSPYMKNGTLSQWRKKTNPSMAEIEDRMLEVARGMEYIHSEGVVHGDLRGDNILLDTDLHVKIADFGLTRLSEATLTRSGALHINFAAPELLGCSQDDDTSADVPARTQKSDVYAFGCLYYEIHYDSIPFASKQGIQILRLVSLGVLPPRRDEPPLDDEAWNLIQCCWLREASKRPAMKDIPEMMMTILNPIPSLLSILKDKEPGSPITSVLNTTTVNLMRKLLSRKDDANLLAQLRDSSDLNDLMDFMLFLLRNDNWSNLYGSVDDNRRAREFMLNVIAKTSVMPRSLFLTEVRVETNRDYISGHFGLVFKGELQGMVIALKVLYKDKGHGSIDIFPEALMWRSLDHQFILPFLGIYENESISQLFLVTPYMENGTLAQWRKKTNPSIAEIEQLILEVAQGIAYIHSEGVVHGDIRGTNILLDANRHVQIAGFGLARISEDLDNPSGAIHFSAPELFGFPEDVQQMAKTYKSDVYAFGCLYYEIYYDAVPFVEKRDVQIMWLVSRGERPPRLDEPPLSDWAWKLMQICWVREALKRPAMNDVVERMMTILDPFAVLLSWLKDKKPDSPITSIVNTTTVNLIHKLLFKEDYINVAAELRDTSVITDLVDFMLYLLCHGNLSNSLHADSRARRLMLNIIAKTPVMPRSLLATRVGAITNRDIINFGRFGLVFKAELQGRLIALKVLHRAYNTTVICREALMWRSLNHKFLLPFSGIYEDESVSQFSLVSPYMENGTLSQWRKNVNPSIAEIKRLILEVAQGIAYIHAEGVVHGDICGANVLLDDEFHAQIAGFGLTRLSEDPDIQTSALHYNFAAPELFGSFGEISHSNENVQPLVKTYKSDVYAFGCLYYEIHYDAVPFARMMQLQIIQLVVQGKRSPRLDEPPLGDSAWNLIRSCWDHEASLRPVMRDVVKRMVAAPNETRNLVLDSDSHPFPSLLSILRDKRHRSLITSVVNTTSIDLLHKLLIREDYIDAAERLSNSSDIKNILEFILFVLRNRYFSNLDPNVNTNRRARRLMSKIISKSRVMPEFLCLTGLAIPGNHHLDVGLVYEGEYEGTAVEIKVLYNARNISNVDFFRAALMWRSFDHKFVLPFLGLYENEALSKLFLVSPRMTNGTLAQWRKRAMPSMLEVELRLMEVARGVHYIHSEGEGVVHGDLCGANVLLDDEFHAQITHFGFTACLESTFMGFGQSLRYNFAAPELFSKDSMARTQESDVYAFGCLYYEIHYGAAPFDGLGILPIVEAVVQGKRPPRLDNPPLHDGAWNLVNQCWTQNKWLRPDMRDVVEIMESWKKPPVLSSPTPSISQSSDSMPRGGDLGPPSDWTGGMFSNHGSDDIHETSKKAEKPTSYNYLAKAYHTIRTNKKRAKGA